MRQTRSERQWMAASAVASVIVGWVCYMLPLVAHYRPTWVPSFLEGWGSFAPLIGLSLVGLAAYHISFDKSTWIDPAFGRVPSGLVGLLDHESNFSNYRENSIVGLAILCLISIVVLSIARVFPVWVIGAWIAATLLSFLDPDVRGLDSDIKSRLASLLLGPFLIPFERA